MLQSIRNYFWHCPLSVGSGCWKTLHCPVFFLLLYGKDVFQHWRVQPHQNNWVQLVTTDLVEQKLIHRMGSEFSCEHLENAHGGRDILISCASLLDISCRKLQILMVTKRLKKYILSSKVRLLPCLLPKQDCILSEG